MARVLREQLLKQRRASAGKARDEDRAPNAVRRRARCRLGCSRRGAPPVRTEGRALPQGVAYGHLGEEAPEKGQLGLAVEREEQGGQRLAPAVLLARVIEEAAAVRRCVSPATYNIIIQYSRV